MYILYWSLIALYLFSYTSALEQNIVSIDQERAVKQNSFGTNAEPVSLAQSIVPAIVSGKKIINLEQGNYTLSFAEIEDYISKIYFLITIHGDYDVRVQILDLPTVLQAFNFYFDSLELDLGSIYLYLWNVFNHLTINNCTFTRSTHAAINQYRLANIQDGGQFIIQQTTIDGKGISGQAPLIEVGQSSYVSFINCIIQNLVVNSLETPVLVQGTNSLDYTLVIFKKVTITGCSAQQSSALYFSISFDNFDHSLPPSRPMQLQIIDSSIISSSQDQYIWGGKNSSE
ncbi:MAG: hypothetical protein EZS28_033299, partial [Streblomastix strix]